MHGDDTRPWTFYAFAAFFTLFVLFLYGPMIVIYILSFQGPSGGMTFPLNGVSLHWFDALISQSRVGDIAGSFQRCRHRHSRWPCRRDEALLIFLAEKEEEFLLFRIE